MVKILDMLESRYSWTWCVSVVWELFVQLCQLVWVKKGELVHTNWSQDGIWWKQKVSFTTKQPHQSVVKTEQLCQACSLTGQTLTPSMWVSGLWDYRVWWRWKVSFMYAHNVSTFHAHISVIVVDSRSLWGAYPGVLSGTPTELKNLWPLPLSC